MFGLLDKAIEILEWAHASGGSIRFYPGHEKIYKDHYGTLEWLCHADPIMLRRIPEYAEKQLGCIAVYELTQMGWHQFE